MILVNFRICCTDVPAGHLPAFLPLSLSGLVIEISFKLWIQLRFVFEALNSVSCREAKTLQEKSKPAAAHSRENHSGHQCTGPAMLLSSQQLSKEFPASTSINFIGMFCLLLSYMQKTKYWKKIFLSPSYKPLVLFLWYSCYVNSIVVLVFNKRHFKIIQWHLSAPRPRLQKSITPEIMWNNKNQCIFNASWC